MPAQVPSDPGPRPPVMTWGKASPVLSIALVFYVLRFIFEQFWLFGPMLVGLIADWGLGGGAVGHAGGTVAAGAAGVVEFFTGPTVEMFGAFMAMMVAFLGWGTVALTILFTNPRFYKENTKRFMFMVGAFIVSELPIIGTVPSLLGTIFGLYRQQIKRDKQRLHAWEAARKAYQEQLRSEQRAQAEQLAGARSGTDDEPEESPEAAENEPPEKGANIKVPGEFSYDFAANNPATNDNEIPVAQSSAA